MKAGQDSLETKAKVTAIEAKLKPGECCSLIYTSGTTGNPKAVMISHDSCTWTANRAFYDVHKMGKDEHVVSSRGPRGEISVVGVVTRELDRPRMGRGAAASRAG